MNIIETALVILCLQLFCFIFAAAFKTDFLTDLSYGLTFACVAVINLWRVDATQTEIIWFAHFGVQLAVLLWGLRLAFFLFYRIHRMGRDKRFDGRRENVWSFALFWALQAVSIWIIYLPGMLLTHQLLDLKNLYFRENYAWPFVIVGLSIFLVGFVLEAVADQQKFKFYENHKKVKVQKSRWIDHGLWSRARHPNYGGEILLWWGLWLVVLPFLPLWQGALAAAGPLWITILLLKISGIPLLDKSAREKYGNDPEYQAYRARTRLLFPL